LKGQQLTECTTVALAFAKFGQSRIWEKWPNFEFAEAEAEIRCNPICEKHFSDDE